MMLAAKQYDIVMGVDIHIIQPPGPVPPIPIPHPFIGMVFDPIDFIPIVGATVLINGIPRAQAGTAAKDIPPHIPLGGVFVKPPANEGEMFMGSSTVLAEGEPFTFMSCQVLSCHDIGMIPPPRPKKKGGTKTMVLPTSIVLPIPAGPTVLVGGSPTISLMAMAMKIGFAALGKIAKKARKAKKPKKIKTKGPKGAPKNKCTKAGHPVDVANGKVFTEKIDFELPGPIPLVWERTWDSSSEYDGPLGSKWHHSYDLALLLHEEEESIELRLSDGRSIAFPIMNIDEQYFHRSEKLTIKRQAEEYTVEDDNQLIYHFNTPNRNENQWPITSITRKSQHAIRFEYDSRFTLKRIHDSAGRKIEVITDEHRRITALLAPHPGNVGETIPIVRYVYDANGDMVESFDAMGFSYKYRFENHLLIQETNANGLNFYFKYETRDEVIRCIHTWGDGGIYDTKLSYNIAEKYTIVENSLGFKTTHYWNDQGVVVRTIDPLGNISAKQYNEDSELMSETDALGRTTIYAYDDLGNRTMSIFPDGSTVQMQYNGSLLVSAIDQVGGNWKWTYDEQGNLIERVNPLGYTTQYTYENGLLKMIRDPAGGATMLSFDRQYNLAALTTPDDANSRWEYDLLGRCTAVIDPKGNAQRRKFNFNGWLRQVNEPDGNKRELEYDAEGNVIRAIDKHYDVRFEYGGMNRMRARVEAGTRVEFKYDAEESLLGIINEHGYAYRFELDANGEVIQEAGFDGIKRQYKRDAAGQVVRVQRASGMITLYEYDALGRVIGVKHSDGTGEKYAYRRDGELVEAVNDHAEVRFERDLLGCVLTEHQGIHTVTSVYDALGMRIDVRSSMGTHVQYQRNIMGDVLSMSANGTSEKWEASFKRDTLGLELERQLPGGIRSTWKRDRLGRPVEQHTVTAGGKTTRQRKYVWDVNDRLKQIIDPQKGTWNFEHDAVGNLASAQYPDGSFEFRMPDAVGNLFKTKDREDRKYGPAGQLLEANGTHYEYDAEGNLLKKTERNGSVWLYIWNAAGMLSEVIRPDKNKVTFRYDALGRRISKTYRGRTTRWVWDGNVILHEWIETAYMQGGGSIPGKESKTSFAQMPDEALVNSPAKGPPAGQATTLSHSIAGVTTWLFEPESFAPLAKLDGGKNYSIVSDHLGSPVGMYDTEGGKVWEMDLSIYGEVRKMIGGREDCPFRYPGQYEDVETGLYYNRFRYYDVEGGFYVSQDPIGLLGNNPTFYGYVKDTNTWGDIFGLDCKIKVGDEIAPNSSVKRIRKGTNGKAIVIGRNMDERVIPAAKNIDAEYWKGFDKSLPNDVNLANNRKWLDQKITDGYTVIDIGLDPKYVNMGGVGSKNKGSFYSMETQVAFGKKW